MHFGEAIRSLRKEMGLSQFALANLIGTTQRHLSFLETGRSNPTKSMLIRISKHLDLGTAQRAALFESSGFKNPFPVRTLDSDEITETLDMIQARVLQNWPFPAFVLGRDWQILRLNKQANSFFAPFVSDQENANLGAIILSDAFRNMIENWQEASAGLYFRLQAAARQSPDLARHFALAQERGVFDHVQSFLTAQTPTPVYVPAVVRLPDGKQLQFVSLLANLGSVYDAIVEEFIIELILPLDAESEDLMTQNFV